MNPELAKALVKAIGYTENGGKPDLNNLSQGKSGELKSIFQFTPDTWKHDAEVYLGDASAPLTPDNETHLMLQKVSKELQQGYTPQQILSMHNAGVGEPNAYSGKFSNGQPSKGKNKYGVDFNVPAYVKTGMNYLSEFTSQNKGGDGHLEPLLSMIKSASTASAPNTPTPTPQEAPPSGLLAQLLSKSQAPQQSGAQV